MIDTELAQKLIELIDARMGRFFITKDGIVLEEADGLKATIPLTKQSQVISTRTIRGV